MGTYDCLSLAYRLLWKLRNLPYEPHLDMVRKMRNPAVEVTKIQFLPQDTKIDLLLHDVIKKRASKGDNWAWEHDLVALDQQASQLTLPSEPPSPWFSNSRRALSGLGKQREGLLSEFYDPLPGFYSTLRFDSGGLGARHDVPCARQVNQPAGK